MTPKIIASYGAIIVSILALLTFIGALIASFFLGEETTLLLAVGAAIANATTAVQFWLGSSSGSQKKDETVAQLAANRQDSSPP